MSLCMATRLFCSLRNQNLTSKLLAKNVCLSTKGLLPCKKNLFKQSSQNQVRFYGSCRRTNPCKMKKKKEEPESFWQSLFSRKRKKPPKHTCRLLAEQNKYATEELPKFIKDMCKTIPPGSAIYKTRGHAFILEVPCKKVPTVKSKSKVDRLVSKIERDKQSPFLEDETNPMPEFTTVGQRLIDLHCRKLHPLYKKLEMPQSTKSQPYTLAAKYRCMGDKMEAFKGSKKLDKELQLHPRRREMFANFKMETLPQYLLNRTRLVEINTHSGLEVKKEKMKVCREKGKYHFTKCPDVKCPTPEKK